MSRIADVRAALRRPSRELQDRALHRAAVAAIINDQRDLWFIQRAERAGDPWSGHVAFPGGRAQRSDLTPLDTAIRETLEETGIDLAGAELLGVLDDLQTRPLRSMAIRPFVFLWNGDPSFSPNSEVVGLHRFSLDDLLTGRGRGVMRWPLDAVGIRLPRVDLGGARLWGLTLQVVDDLLHRIDGRGVGLERPAESARVGGDPRRS